MSRLSDLAFAKQKCTMRCYVFNLFVIFPRPIRGRYFQHRTPLFFAFSEQIAQRSMSSMQKIWLFKKPFRRGTTTEMANSGHSLDEILVAGQWKSSAFAHYLSTGTLILRASLGLLTKQMSRTMRKRPSAGVCNWVSLPLLPTYHDGCAL